MIFQRESREFYPDRAPGRNFDYCDIGRDAVAGFECSEGKSKDNSMHEQPEAARHYFAMYFQNYDDYAPVARWGGATVKERWLQSIYEADLFKNNRIDQYLGCTGKKRMDRLRLPVIPLLITGAWGRKGELIRK